MSIYLFITYPEKSSYLSLNILTHLVHEKLTIPMRFDLMRTILSILDIIGFLPARELAFYLFIISS